jgi:transcriptional regulatory protein LevR
VVDGSRDAPVSLAQRLAFLAESGVISATARRLTEEAMVDVETRVGLPDDDVAAALATHVAMALTRLDRNEPDAKLPEIATEELESRPEERAFARQLADRWERELGRPVPAAEIGYVALHLAALAEAAP